MKGLKLLVSAARPKFRLPPGLGGPADFSLLMSAAMVLPVAPWSAGESLAQDPAASPTKTTRAITSHDHFAPAVRADTGRSRFTIASLRPRSCPLRSPARASH